MDRLRYAELELKMRHRHGDGSWGTLQPRPQHHSPSEHDPERDWSSGTIYECTTCDEEVQIVQRQENDKPR